MRAIRGIGLVLLIVSGLPAQTQEKVEKYPNGAVKLRYSVDPTGKKVGTFTTYHQDGSVELKAIYHDDLLDGSYETYYPNGAPHLVASYARGKLSGRYEDSSEDGTRTWS